MKWLLIILGIFAVMIVGLLVLGLLQPARHSVTRSIRLKLKPETVFAALANFEDLPKWSTTVLKVERLPDRDGKPVARITMKWGHMEMVMTQLERTPPIRLVVSAAQESGATLGTWTYELASESDGCRVSLTEQGEMKNPFYRAIGRLRGLDSNITQTLRDLAKKFGEDADIQLGP
ncbi:MAG TPA: SRPBCC family protein [Verrucomicrobiae bacterium]|nr:SRPBCC family protein [Verrucomicrobiae bacterium]